MPAPECPGLFSSVILRKEFHVWQKLFPGFQTDPVIDKTLRSVRMEPAPHRVSEFFQPDILLPETDHNDFLRISFRPYPVRLPEYLPFPETFWKQPGSSRKNDNLPEAKVLLPDKAPESGKKY